MIIGCGGGSETAREDALLAFHGIKDTGWNMTAIPEEAVPRPDDSDPIDLENIRTVRGYSLTMLGQEGLSVDPNIVDRLRRVPVAKFPRDDLDWV